MNKLVFIVLLFFFSCTRKENKYYTIIHKADKIQVKKNNGIFDTTIVANKSMLDSFREIFENDEGKCSCQPKDEVIFYEGNLMLLKTGISQYDKDCAFLIIESGEKKKCYRLNYRIGMFIGEL